jgi:hypothetical protein
MTSDRSGAAIRFSDAPTRRNKPTAPHRQAQLHVVAEDAAGSLQIQLPDDLPTLGPTAAALLGDMIQRALVSARQDDLNRRPTA